MSARRQRPCIQPDNGISPEKAVQTGREKEPFPDIKFDNEVSSDAIKSRSGRKLLLDIAEEAGSTIINNITAWQEMKFNEYAGSEDRYSIDVHLRIMRELSAIDVETIKKFDKFNCLRLLDRNNEYNDPKKLTLGTKYNPSCHFERNGVKDGIQFVSDRYDSINDRDEFSSFMKNVLRCHHRFEEKDLVYLKHYRFCMYFWTEYVPKHIEFIENLIEDHKFDDIECVPTLAGNVYVPADVYSRGIKDYVVNKNILVDIRIPDMIDEVRRMLKTSIDAYIRLDEKKAQSVIDADDVLDGLFVSAKSELVNMIKTSFDGIEEAPDALLAAKYLERMGDHCVNLSKQLIWTISGEIN